MNERQQIADRIQRLIVKRNRELTFEALAEGLLGLVFCLATFGGVFALTWMICIFVVPRNGLAAWQIALGVAALFAVVSLVSAWRNENVIAGLAAMTDKQRLISTLTRAAGLGSANPEYATAGIALLLVAGPQNLVRALGTWKHRFPEGSAVSTRAAEVLAACQQELAIDRLPDLKSCVILRRLLLVRPIERSEFTAIALTEKGRSMLDKSLKN